MAVASQRIWNTIRLTNTTAQIIYTVPAGKVAIVRSCVVANVQGTAVQVTLRINGTTGATVFIDTLLAGGAYIVTPYLILNPGDVFRGRTGTVGGLVDVNGFGSVLEL